MSGECYLIVHKEQVAREDCHDLLGVQVHESAVEDLKLRACPLVPRNLLIDVHLHGDLQFGCCFLDHFDRLTDHDWQAARNHDFRIAPLAIDNNAECHTKRTQRAVRGVVMKIVISGLIADLEAFGRKVIGDS